MIDPNVPAEGPDDGDTRSHRRDPSDLRLHLDLYTVRIGVLHLELMKNPSMLARQVGDLAFPFVELTKCHRIAVQCRKAAPIFENRIRQQVRVALAGRREGLAFRPAQFFK